MARRPRNEIADGIYHAYGRGVAKQQIFRDDVDRRTFLTLFARVVREMGWRCLTYCLMENHYHLLIRTPEANLGRGMQRLLGGYVSTFNARHDRVGPLFQGRFGSVPITSDPQLLAAVAYVVRNPVDAGLCKRAEEWRWSSHRAVATERPPSWLDADGLLSYFGDSNAKPLDAYTRLIGRGLVGTEGTDPPPGAVGTEGTDPPPGAVGTEGTDPGGHRPPPGAVGTEGTDPPPGVVGTEGTDPGGLRGGRGVIASSGRAFGPRPR